jgi:hypothetical protein
MECQTCIGGSKRYVAALWFSVFHHSSFRLVICMLTPRVAEFIAVDRATRPVACLACTVKHYAHHKLHRISAGSRHGSSRPSRTWPASYTIDAKFDVCNSPTDAVNASCHSSFIDEHDLLRPAFVTFYAFRPTVYVASTC